VIFVDTGAWIARFYPADQHHRAARDWFAQNGQPLLTTDYIIDEALTVLKARGEPRRALQLGGLFFSGQLTRIHYRTLLLSPRRAAGATQARAWQLFLPPARLS